jgi:hypothetical protein
VVSGQWSVVSGQWSVVSGQWSVVSGQWSDSGIHHFAVHHFANLLTAPIFLSSIFLSIVRSFLSGVIFVRGDLYFLMINRSQTTSRFLRMFSNVTIGINRTVG